MLHVERSNESARLVIEFAGKGGLQIHPDADGQLNRFVEALLDWNTRHNLISRAETDQVWTKHVLHSAGILVHAPLPEKFTFADIGTGGGFPGIPVAILRPDSNGFLIESIGKKVEAVKAIAVFAGVRNVRVLHGRAEDPAVIRSAARSCDVVFARAVAPLAKLAAWSKPLLKKPDGRAFRPSLIALKGGDLTEELSDLKRRFPAARASTTVMDFGDASPLIDKKLVIVTF